MIGRQLLALPVVLLAATLATAADFTIGARAIRVPEGFEIELAAGSPLVDRPISIARDERGRLYATDSAGMSERADKQLAAKPHRIVRLTDTDGDGRYDKSTVFADKMMFPEGCLWYEGSLYVAAPPQIWKLTDADDDGVAEHREVWFDGKTLTGCANDLHGPYLGRDGWIYWCKGAFAEQNYLLPNGKPFTTRASHIFRSRPDGSGMEPVLTGGMDNPVNVAFLTTGERILSCTFFQQPEAGRRDGLIHAIYGGVYGKRHDPIYSHKMTGDIMPVLVHQGAAAPCGLTSGNDGLFGGGYRDQLFACYFNLHKVVRHQLSPEGPTFRTLDEDFVACDHPDFHPTDVYEDADGSLLVVDTGGWYKVCCPTSQLAKPDVLGAIYRVRKKGAPRMDDPLGTKIAWGKLSPAELTPLLSDDRLFVRRRATSRLRQLGEPAATALRAEQARTLQPATRREIVWALASIDAPASREAVRESLADRNSSVAQAAAHVAGLRRDADALDALFALVGSSDAALARVAAEAIGRIGDRRAVPALLTAIEKLPTFTPDVSGAPSVDSLRVSEHALIYALIEIGDAPSLASALTSPKPQVRRAALVAVDQMDSSPLEAASVIALLDHDDAILKRTAQWIVSHRPAWGSLLVDYFHRRFSRPPAVEADQAALATQLAQLGKSAAIQELLASLSSHPSTDARRIAWRAMAEARLTATPPAWLDALAMALPRCEFTLLAQAVSTVRALPQPKGGHAALRTALIRVGELTDAPIDARLNALVAAGGVGAIDDALFAVVRARVLPDEPLDLRGAAATIIAQANLTVEQRLALLETVRQVGPLELPKLLPAFERDPKEAFGLKMIDALTSSAGMRGLRADLVKPLLAKYPSSVQQAGQKLVDQLAASAAQQAAHLERLLVDLPQGDIRRGHEVFLSNKAACATCHAVGYLGGRMGPDLTSIGKVRTRRDLLEAIVYPSASFVRSYEPMLVILDDGRTATGIVVKETGDELLLATAPTQTIPIARRGIVEMHPGAVSLMPQGIDKLLDNQQIADLLEYLMNVQR